ncbi:MAG: DUF2269 family protein [Actinomycetota bacterium]
MDLVVLVHVLVAFAFVAGLVGRDITIAQARRSSALSSITALLAVANRFDTIVKIGSIAVLVFGLVAMVVGDLSLSDNGWLIASLALYVALGLLVPIVFLPRGRVFEAALAHAKQRGEVTPELTAAFHDPAVALARNAELVIVAVIIGLMVLKPF